MTGLETIALGCAGGAIPDVLRIIKGRYQEMLGYLGSWYFWVGFVLLLIVGGVVAYFAEPTRAIDALAFGFSAPTILAKFVGEHDPPDHFNIKGDVLGGIFESFAPSSIPIPNPVVPIQKWWAS